MKTRILIALITVSVLSLLLSACAGGPPIMGEMVNGYIVDDATCARAGMTWEECKVYYAALPRVEKPQPTATAELQPTATVAPTRMPIILYYECEKIADNEAISQTLERGNGGVFPAYSDEYGRWTIVVMPTGERFMLEKLMDDQILTNLTVYPGQEICWTNMTQEEANNR